MPEPQTIVLVDDAPEVRALLRVRLRLARVGEVVGEGADGNDAVALARQHQPDLMVLDLSMPDLDGLGALAEIRTASPGTRVVIYSGFAETGLAEVAVRRGASAFVQKSADPTPLLDTLRRLSASEATAGSVPEDEASAPPTHAADTTPAPGGDATYAAELSQHVERFADVFEDAAIGMATLTLQGRVVRANGALRRLLEEEAGPAGASGGAVGRPYAELLGGDQRVAEALTRLTGGDADVVEVEHPLTHRRLRTTLSPVRDERGRALYLFAQTQDVTAEVQAGRELLQSERRFRLLVEAVSDYAIFMLDPQGHIASWNSGAQRSKGWTAEEIVGQHFGVFYPPEVRDSGHPQHELEMALRDGSYSEEGWRVRKDGSRFWAHVTITAVHDEDGTHIGFAKVTRDHTERHRMLQDQRAYADALAEANHQLEQANAMLAATAADQAQFLAVTAHELRTPISVMSMSGRTLNEHWRELDDGERGELLEGLIVGSTRLQRLLNDLLTTSRIQASTLELSIEEVDLAGLLAPLGDELRRLHDSTEVTFTIPVTARVRADPGRVVQIVQNLVSNALMHGRPPVQLRVRGAEPDDDRRRDQERWPEASPGVVLEVADAGAGVAPDLIPRLFERFATRGAAGTGLGLHIVRELARAQAGEAWYDEERHTFAVLLPGRVGT